MNKNIKNALLLSAVMSVSGAWAADEVPQLTRRGSFSDYASVKELKDSKSLPAKLIVDKNKAGAKDLPAFEADIQKRRDLLDKFLTDKAQGLGDRPADLADADLPEKPTKLYNNQPDNGTAILDDEGNITGYTYKRNGMERTMHVADSDMTEDYQTYLQDVARLKQNRENDQKLYDQTHVAATELKGKAETWLAQPDDKKRAYHSSLGFNDAKKKELRDAAQALGVTFSGEVTAEDKVLFDMLEKKITAGHVKVATYKPLATTLSEDDSVRVGDIKNLNDDKLAILWALCPAAKAAIDEVVVEAERAQKEVVDLKKQLAAAKAKPTAPALPGGPKQPTPPPALPGDKSKPTEHSDEDSQHSSRPGTPKEPLM